METEILIFPWEVYKVEPAFVKGGKTILAYRPNYWSPPASNHTMRYIRTVEAPTEKAAIALCS
jgi:hypothetical protein